MADFFDKLETRSDDERAAAMAVELPDQLLNATHNAPAMAARLGAVDLISITDRAALSALPILRKAELGAAQQASPPFGGYSTGANFAHVFQSPGPIYEPAGRGDDWFRLARFLYATGVRAGDVVQNCFSYHLTPAGLMFESAAKAVGATVFPAGTGQTELQVRGAAQLGVTAYAGTPDYLKIILDKADEMGVDLSGITRAGVGGGALFPSLRAEYADRGIKCLQCYATADLGNIAYESDAMQGMIVDEGVIVEIVTPGTGIPVADGEVGEVIVTTLNRDYPLIRFATGDLSAVMAGISPCGRTNMRIRGWMGRADQTTKIKGMFVRPEQVAALVAAHPEIIKARVVVERQDETDVMTVQVEAVSTNANAISETAQAFLKLRGNVEICAPGSLPKDGKVIDDRRNYD